MACGCKGKSGPIPAINQTASAPAGRTTARVAVYEVKKDSQVVLSTTSPTAARTEARRVGGSVGVTSRPVAQGEPRAEKVDA